MYRNSLYFSRHSPLLVLIVAKSPHMPSVVDCVYTWLLNWKSFDVDHFPAMACALWVLRSPFLTQGHKDTPHVSFFELSSLPFTWRPLIRLESTLVYGM